MDASDPYQPPPSLVRPFLARDNAGGPSQAGDPGAELLRPYLLTAGRVRPIDSSLEIESQVLTTERGLALYQRMEFEHRDILGLCTTAMSVAEVAAKLSLHIGVAKVLVADLAALDCLIVQRP